MDEKTEKQPESNKKGWIGIGGVFLVGYLLGIAANGKAYNQGYKNGVTETLSHVLFRLDR